MSWLSNFGDWITDASDTKKINQNQGALNTLMTNRPLDEIPQGATNAYNLAVQASKSDMPGYDKAKNDITGMTSQSVKDINKESNSVSGALGATADIYGSSLKQLAGLDVAQSQYKQQQAQERIKAEQMMGEQQQQVFNWNTLQKYGEQYNYLQSQISQAKQDKGQFTQNMFGVLDAGLGVAGSVLGGLAKSSSGDKTGGKTGSTSGSSGKG